MTKGEAERMVSRGSWYHRQESNLYLALRRRSFYPLNYEERGWILVPFRWHSFTAQAFGIIRFPLAVSRAVIRE